MNYSLDIGLPSVASLCAFRGTEVDTAGDGFFATFDGPARAILCAAEVVADASELGLSVRAGVHTGECDLSGEEVAGVAVHIGARVAAEASAGGDSRLANREESRRRLEA